ncbi:hypothetical protein WOLCODRAFT_29534 [Wolfiporia cocos MD-104 SS10]|uniref:Uncharacterized protein n=1 Tax=Wolfiporia cocos (strain MD-104) TaxID=742152 RepID=A0A2H3JKR7_WOLCO|nr:hypothetical protein WOLCODRAFT_29534 [Wolfiporia cocos MD-104 SS10]
MATTAQKFDRECTSTSAFPGKTCLPVPVNMLSVIAFRSGHQSMQGHGRSVSTSMNVPYSSS